jgi:hypothetical protein
MEEKGMIRFDDWTPGLPEPGKRKEGGRHMGGGSRNPFWRDYKILIVGAAVFTIYTILLSSWVSWRTETRVHAEMDADYERRVAQRIAEYHEQRQQEQAAEYFLSGEASREAFINQEIDAVAPVIAKLTTDAQKYTEASCMLARVMSPSYPNSFQEVAKQPKQWMFYDGTDNNFSDHDREIAEKIVRPYLESGKIPNGLTAELVHGSWSTNDYVLRDDYEGSGTMTTWRYPG